MHGFTLVSTLDMFTIHSGTLAQPRECSVYSSRLIAVLASLLQELKRVCLDFVSRNLAAVMQTDGYRYMTRSCPSLQAELLQVIATAAPAAAAVAGHDRIHKVHGPIVRRLEDIQEERRVRQRRNDM